MYKFRREELSDSILMASPDYISVLVPDGPLQLTLESYETFKQEDKELLLVDLMWPKIQVFKNVSAFDEVPTVHCETITGKPDYLFVLLEHVRNKPATNTGNNPHR